MHKIKQTLIILILIQFNIIIFSSQLSAQEKYKRKICISEWIEEMEQCEYPGYKLENAEIYYDHQKDSLYSWSQPRYTKPLAKDLDRVKIIKPLILIYNCKLPDIATCQVRNIIFQNNIRFYNCEGAVQLIFYNCTFKQGVDFHKSDFGDIEFRYCSILQRTVIYGFQVNSLFYSDCDFYTDHKVVKNLQNYGFEEENHTYQYLFIINQNEKSIKKFYLINCKLLPTEVKPVIFFNGGKYDVVSFQNTNFSNSLVNFINCSVKENFTVQNCKFDHPFGINRFNFPKDNTSFLWSQLDSVGLGLYYDYNKFPFTNKIDTLFTDVNVFNELNSSYRKFFSMYKTQGDMESANACYIQMKDMETIKYRHLYQQNQNIHTWFNWRFNQFLKYFSKYGTNPIESLIFSMWTILIFAAVYFFFYSNWDGINRAFLIKKHRTLMLYFSSEQRLEDFYTENYIEDLKSFDEYKKEMKESKINVPLFIVLLGKPLYLFSVIKYKLVSFIYRRSEILQGRWIDLKPMRKVIVSITVFISVIIYLIYLCIIRALNATTLSVNAFSTLGFGSIPVKGASRYITILEGFLGWFLLSIFSVSLISQMIQN